MSRHKKVDPSQAGSAAGTHDSETQILLQAGKLARKKLYHGLLAKVQGGKSLSASEMKHLQLLEQQIGSEAKVPINRQKEIHVTTAQLAYLFGISERQITNWVRQKGCPKLKHGLFDLKAVFDWWLESDIAATRTESEDLQNVKLEYWREKMLRERIKRQQEEDLLIPQPQIAKAWAWRMAEMVSGLNSLRHRLPPLLEGKDQAAMSQVIAEELWKLRDNYCRNGQFCCPCED